MEIDESILLDYFDNKLSQEQVDLIEKWYVESESNQRFYKDVFILYKTSSIESNKMEIDVDACFQRFNKRNRFRNIKWLYFTRYVAAFFIGVCCSVGLYSLSLSVRTVEPMTIMTAKDERASVKLPDGSLVALNSNTQIQYKEGFWTKDRKVNLVGEAYFEVVNNNNPFIVRSKDIDIKVLGTKFNVRSRASEKDVITTLLEGSVYVNSEKMLQEYVLRPGESLKINSLDGTSDLFSYNIPENILLWRTGKLIFDHTPLLEITQTLEQHFNTSIIINSKDLENELFTCEFSTQSTIDNILIILSLTNKFTFERLDDNVIEIKKM